MSNPLNSDSSTTCATAHEVVPHPCLMYMAARQTACVTAVVVCNRSSRIKQQASH